MKTKRLMKKAIAVLLGITMSFGILCVPGAVTDKELFSASAYIYTVGDCKFTYRISYDRDVTTLTLDSVEGHGETLTIPSYITVDGKEYAVNKIGQKFLKGDTTIKNIIFPETVKSIDWYVLSDSSVQNITLPDGLEELSAYFASNCKDLDTVNYSGTKVKPGKMGHDIFKDSNTTNLVNEDGVLCLGNWLLNYPKSIENETVKIADLGINGIKIENIAYRATYNLQYASTIDLEGVKYIDILNFEQCFKIKSVVNYDDVEQADNNIFKGSPWFEKAKSEGQLIKFGKVLMYYKTDSKVIDLTSGELEGTKCVCDDALTDCTNLETLMCDSDCVFENGCFYEANKVYSDGSFREDQFPEKPMYKIKNVYLDGKKVSIHELVEDSAVHNWLKNNLLTFDNSEFTKELVKQKTEYIFKQMDIPYYGPGNDKIGTLTPTEEFYIRLKIFSYISMYDYDHNHKYRTVAGGLLLGGKFTCTEYALVAHYFLECAGVKAKTFFSDPTDPNATGVHFWNATKLGDEWFLSDDGWSAQNNNHGYGWLLQSYSAFNTSELHTMMISYDSYHFYAESRNTEEITADRFFGDIDGDNDRDNDDAVILWKYIKGVSSTIYKKRADINLDGKIDVTDAVLLDNMVNRKAIDTDNVPIDGFAPGFWIAFLNGDDYDNIKYLYTDREGYLTLPNDLFEAPEGKKISYDVGKANQKVRLTTPLQVVNVKWIDENEPDYSEPESSKPDSSKPDSSNSSSKTDDKFKLGDVNGDRTIDIEDAVSIIQNINGMTPLKADEEKRADVSKDGNIDIDDAVILISYINGNSTF